MSDIGKELKRLRKAKRLTIRELSKKSGISHPYISQIENGKRNVSSSEILQKLSEPLEADYTELLIKAGLIDNFNNVDFKDLGMSDLSDFEKRKIPITIQLPTGISYKLEDNKYMHRTTSPNDVFDIFYLLNMATDIYYKNKLLTADEREKILNSIDSILEK